MKNRTALVAGTGIAGLAAGLALLEAGRRPVLLGGPDTLEPPSGFVELDDQVRAALAELGIDGVGRRVGLAELHARMLEAIGRDRIRPGHAICCARSDERLARVHLLDGSDLAAPLLVDAGGRDSRVRASLYGFRRRRRDAKPLPRRADGRIALLGGDVDAIEDAAALARALLAEPILTDALDRYAREARPARAAARTRRRARGRFSPIPAFEH